MSTAVLTREEAKQSAQEKKPRSTKLPLGTEELKKIDAYWRAANYLSVGQIYLYDNPLLKEPLTKEHIKPRFRTGSRNDWSILPDHARSNSTTLTRRSQSRN